MLTKSLFLSINIFFALLANSQEKPAVLDFSKYFEQRAKVDSLLALKKYKDAANAFSKAFAINNQMYPSGDRYEAAKVWALAGNKDSALFNLQKEVQLGFSNYDQLIAEKVFKKIKNDTGWKDIAQLVKQRQDNEDTKLGIYKPIKKELERRLELDQKYRSKLWADVELNYGVNSKQYKSFIKKVKALDKDNLKCVTNIIDTSGWISHDIIGSKASQALFLVIQHSDSATHEKYLPIMRQAVKEHKANSYYLALLEDRVLINRGEKQLYGTQYTCDDNGKNCKVLPIADEKNVDKKRKEMGMEPLAQYLKISGIDYDTSKTQ